MHEGIEPAFPPLIQRGGTGRRQRSAENSVEKCEKIYGTVCAQIKTNRCRQQNEKRQPRFDQLRKIGKHADASRVGFHQG